MHKRLDISFGRVSARDEVSFDIKLEMHCNGSVKLIKILNFYDEL